MDMVKVTALEGFRTVAEGKRKKGAEFEVPRHRLAFLTGRKLVKVTGKSETAKAAAAEAGGGKAA